MVNINFLKKKHKGFTLTELLVVISIIAFLVALVVIYLRSQIFKGNDARRKGDIHNISIAIEEYEKDNDCYPRPELIICKPGTGLRPYLDKIPCDPVTNASYYIEMPDSVCPNWYRIYARLENDKDSDISRVGCTYGCGPDYSFNYYAGSPNSPIPPQGSGPTGSGASEPPGEFFYGCINGICEIVIWDPERPGPECDPHFQNPTCYDQCGEESSECKHW